MINVQAGIMIERPIEEVFAYVADPRNLPAWSSAVVSVRPADGATSPTRYVMERNLPVGLATNEFEVVAEQPNREFTLRTTSGPTPFAYRIRFTPVGQGTRLDVDVSASLGLAGGAAGPLARAFVRRGVNDNLATLKAILERARVRPIRRSVA
jgi:uncharacterized membrane protein